MRREFFRDDFLAAIEQLSLQETDGVRVIISFVSKQKMDEFVTQLAAGLLEGKECQYKGQSLKLALSAAVAEATGRAADSKLARRTFNSLNAVSLSEPLGVIYSLSDNGHQLGIADKGIEEDSEVRTMLDKSLPLIEAPAVHQREIEGRGIAVGVLDTGIDESHRDFYGRLKGQKDFSGEGNGDGHGHGTHVAGIIAGSGAQSGGQYRGVAPQAELLIAKVLTSQGRGSLSNVIAGVEWCVAEQADVLNLSLGGGPTDGTDALSRSVNWAVEQGVVVCVAAGNTGPGAGTVGSPGVAARVITVGAVDDFDNVAQFSSRGPTPDGREKPDVLMPGVIIISCRSSGTSMGRTINDDYTEASGTSMATPHAAGACALLIEARAKKVSPQEVKQRLRETARDLSLPANTQGAGRCNVNKAVTAAEVKKPVITLQKAEMEWNRPLHQSDIERVLISVKNTGSAAANDVHAHLKSSQDTLRILECRGDYGTLDPGEDDRDAFLVEAVGADQGVHDLTAVFSYTTVSGKREQATLTVPVRVAGDQPGEAGETTAWITDRLYERHPELKQEPALVDFLAARQVGFWGEHALSAQEQTVHIVDETKTAFLVVTETASHSVQQVLDSTKLESLISIETALAKAKKQASAILGNEQAALQTVQVFPSTSDEADRATRQVVWVVEQSVQTASARAVFKVQLSALSGDVLRSETAVSTSSNTRELSFGDALFNA